MDWTTAATLGVRSTMVFAPERVVASLFVIQGPDQGRRYELGDQRSEILGRDATASLRLHDQEVSRRHAEVRVGAQGGHEVVDLNSANGTFVNGEPVKRAILKPGDHLRIGQSVLLYGDSRPRSTSASCATASVPARVEMPRHSPASERSEIVRAVSVAPSPVEGSRVVRQAEERLRSNLASASLATIYQTTAAVGQTLDLDALLPQILDLAFEATGADRGAVLLGDSIDRLEIKAARVRRGNESEADASGEATWQISRTIPAHVLSRGEAVLSFNAPADERFDCAASIDRFGIVEVLCVPLQGRHSRLGVLYVDVRSHLGAVVTPDGEPSAAPAPIRTRTRFTDDHLTLLAAIGYQAGLAIENTAFHEAKLRAERLAAVGQTIALISHDVKNILQGMNSGSHLVQLGLKSGDLDLIRKGWRVVEKNQGKISNLVLDMLSYSKERRLILEPDDLNALVNDVADMLLLRAEEQGITLEVRTQPNLPLLPLDSDALSRALLNLVGNALDAVEEVESPRVVLSTHYDPHTAIARIVVEDNGKGIPESERDTIFEWFASSKGTRGTGLGLPVALKIVREHGGTLTVESQVGVGTRFIVELPIRRGLDELETEPYSSEPEEADDCSRDHGHHGR